MSRLVSSCPCLNLLKPPTKVRLLLEILWYIELYPISKPRKTYTLLSIYIYTYIYIYIYICVCIPAFLPVFNLTPYGWIRWYICWYICLELPGISHIKQVSHNSFHGSFQFPKCRHWHYLIINIRIIHIISTDATVCITGDLFAISNQNIFLNYGPIHWQLAAWHDRRQSES